MKSFLKISIPLLYDETIKESLSNFELIFKQHDKCGIINVEIFNNDTKKAILEGTINVLDLKKSSDELFSNWHG